MRRFLQPPQRSPLLYLKEFPFHLNSKAMEKVRTAGQFFGIMLLTAFITFIFLNNITPFGLTVHYSLQEKDDSISPLLPEKRVLTELKNGQTIFHQSHDLIYFKTKMPFLFDEATVKITYRNPAEDQSLAVGFQDQNLWHYNTQLFDVPFLNHLSWSSIGENPTLYQKEKNFDSVDEFLRNPPQGLFIGTYAYDKTIGNAQIHIPDYQKSATDTIIDVPLRGTHVMYAYLENEPFHMIIQKQDLNWYEDPDTMTVNVYKDDDLVYQLIADDDGIQNASKKILPPQELDISNPGPDLPENGVYKIVIESDGDTIIKRITTNLHKIVFANSVFPVANANSYWPNVASTSATTLYTNSLLLSATTYHNAGLQNISVDNQLFPVLGVKDSNFITPLQPVSQIIIPNSDIIMNGYQGFFSFQPDQFFDPSPYDVIPIQSKTDIDLIDYIVTDYTPSKTYGDWQIAEKKIDIRSAYIKNGELSWVIMAPKLQENNREILIKNVEVTFHKNPWINFNKM